MITKLQRKKYTKEECTTNHIKSKIIYKLWKIVHLYINKIVHIIIIILLIFLIEDLNNTEKIKNKITLSLLCQ